MWSQSFVYLSRACYHTRWTLAQSEASECCVGFTCSWYGHASAAVSEVAIFDPRFFVQFAKIASPLHNLLRKEMEFAGTKECQAVFKNLT